MRILTAPFLEVFQKFKYDHIGRLKESAEYRGDNGNLTYKQVFDFDRFGNHYRKFANNPTAGRQNPLAFTPIEESTGPGTGDIEKGTNRFRTGTTYDDAGQVTSADAQRTYVGGVNSSANVNGAISQITLGNGTTETFTINNRFQIESQTLKKGAEVLQKYDYKYGKINSTDGTVNTTTTNGQLARIESFIGAGKQSRYDSLDRLSQSAEYQEATAEYQERELPRSQFLGG